MKLSINISISILHMLYRKSEQYERYDGEVRNTWQDVDVGMFGISSFLIYYLLLFLVVWVINGFKKDEV